MTFSEATISTPCHPLVSTTIHEWTANKTTTRTNKTMKLKPVIIGTGYKGGTGKTTGLVSVADSLAEIGYTMRFVDADSSNRTLTGIYPEAETDGRLVKVNLGVPGDFQGALENIAATMTEDLAIIDMPGSAAEFFEEYFLNKTAEDFEIAGLRMIIAVTVANSAGSLRGIRALVRMFAEKRHPLLVLKTNMANTYRTAFNLTETNTGAGVAIAAENRIIEIPQFGELQKKEFNKCNAAPSAFLRGGRAAEKLGLGHLSCLEWHLYLRKVLGSVEPYAEWITGLPIPKTPQNAKPHSAHAAILDAMDDDDL